MNATENTISTTEPWKLPLILRIGKWMFWITVILYVLYIGMIFYLDWIYPGWVSITIIDTMEKFYSFKTYFWFFTIISIAVWISQLLYKRIPFHKSKFIIILWILIFTIFWYQRDILDLSPSEMRYPVIIPGCNYCGRPFRLRSFFSRLFSSWEANIKKSAAWNTIK